MKNFLSVFLVLFAGSWAAALPVQDISLASCEASALAFSPSVRAAKAQAESARASYESTRAALYPGVYLDASGSWVSEVPEVSFGPQSAAFGSKWGYSAGPTLEYTLFDKGARSSASDSARAVYQAKLLELSLARKQALLQVRQAYFALQRDLENIYLLSEQLKVARKQVKDVQSAFDAGAKSRLDVLMAQKQVLRASVDVSGARGALGDDLRALFKLTGTAYGIDPAYALDSRVQEKLEGQTTAILRADDPGRTAETFAPMAGLGFDADTPRLAALDELVKSYEYAARGFSAAVWPRVGISAGAYWQYPNGPVREDVFLGKAAVSLRLPLFEGGKNRSKAAAQDSAAEAARAEKQEAEEALQALFLSAKDNLLALDIETNLAVKLVGTAGESARLTYQAYQAGAVTFLEVDDANLAALQSRIMLSELIIQRLNRLAVMDSLGK